jgi:hypothetical protein
LSPSRSLGSPLGRGCAITYRNHSKGDDGGQGKAGREWSGPGISPERMPISFLSCTYIPLFRVDSTPVILFCSTLPSYSSVSFRKRVSSIFAAIQQAILPRYLGEAGQTASRRARLARISQNSVSCLPTLGRTDNKGTTVHPKNCTSKGRLFPRDQFIDLILLHIPPRPPGPLAQDGVHQRKWRRHPACHGENQHQHRDPHAVPHRRADQAQGGHRRLYVRSQLAFSVAGPLFSDLFFA